MPECQHCHQSFEGRTNRLYCSTICRKRYEIRRRPWDMVRKNLERWRQRLTDATTDQQRNQALGAIEHLERRLEQLGPRP